MPEDLEVQAGLLYCSVEHCCSVSSSLARRGASQAQMAQVTVWAGLRNALHPLAGNFKHRSFYSFMCISYNTTHLHDGQQ